jgi:hypothetical protein
MYNPFLVNQNQPPAQQQAQQQGFSYGQGITPKINVDMNLPYGNQFNDGKQQQTQQPNGSNKAGQVAGGIAGVMNAYAQGAAATDGFSIDQNAGLKGSFQGLAQGGPMMAVVQGIAGQVGTFSQQRRNLNRLRTSIMDGGNDAYGNPIYNGAGVNQMRNVDRELKAGEQSIAKAWDPASHIGDTIFRAKKRLRKKRQEVEQGIYNMQSNFNQANINSEIQQQAQAAYNRSLKELFSSPTSLPSQYNIY